jgi:hypothetical protein
MRSFEEQDDDPEFGSGGTGFERLEPLGFDDGDICPTDEIRE